MSVVVDVCMNLYTPEVVQNQPPWRAQFIENKIGNRGIDHEGGMSIAQHLEMLDEAGIDMALVPAIKAGPEGLATSNRIPYSVVAKAVEESDGRLLGLAGIDPTEGMRGVRELELAVRDFGFVGAHFYPHWFDMAPDDRRMYPFYAKCIELDIPIQMQVGHCLRYNAERPLRSVGRPITLDTIACDLPEVKLVGIHVGWPWTEEMIAVAYKHPNVYIGTDAYAPKYLPKELIHFINSWGNDKVLFGTDFPVISPKRAMDEVAELGLKEQSLPNFLGHNTLRLYGIEPHPAE